jgi:hypothetical protein
LEGGALEGGVPEERRFVSGAWERGRLLVKGRFARDSRERKSQRMEGFGVGRHGAGKI